MLRVAFKSTTLRFSLLTLQRDSKYFYRPFHVTMSNNNQPTQSNDKPGFINIRYSVGPDGKSVFDLDFVEEPLGMPASDKYGWPQFEFGESIGPDNRYVLTRKLG